MVFGGLMLDNVVWDIVGDYLYKEDFFWYEYWLIFIVISELVVKDVLFDVVMVLEVIEDFLEVGGLVYFG